MNRIAEMKEAAGELLLFAAELPASDYDLKDRLVTASRYIEAQIEGVGDEMQSPMSGDLPRLSQPPNISGGPVPGGRLDPSQQPQVLQESKSAVISLRIKINLPQDPEEAEQVKNNYVSNLFKAIEGSGGSIVGHDVKEIAAKQSGGA